MRWLPHLIPALIAALGLVSSPTQAEEWVVQVTETEEWIDESDPRFFEDDPADVFIYAEDLGYAALDNDGESAGRAITSFRARTPNALAAFGPFRVVDPTRAVLVGTTDATTPAGAPGSRWIAPPTPSAPAVYRFFPPSRLSPPSNPMVQW